MSDVVIGTLASSWRAVVDGAGTIHVPDGPPVRWLVGAADRWRDPAAEPSRRQRLLDGTPVVETAVKVPGGDAVHRVWVVADLGGVTVVEVENRSGSPFAVAFSGRDLVATRPRAAFSPPGLDLPAGTAVYPVAHRTTLRVAFTHGGATVLDPGRLAALPAASNVARGWRALVERGEREVLPDAALAEALVRDRCQLLLSSPPDADDDPIAWLVHHGELARLGEVADERAVFEAARLASALARPSRRRPLPGEAARAAIDAAATILRVAGEEVGARDLDRLGDRLAGRVAGAPATARVVAPPASPGSGGGPAFRLAAARSRIVAAGPHHVELLPGFPPSWLGADLEVHGVVTRHGRVSFAVRWHGARPALLWQLDGGGDAEVELRATALDPRWSARTLRGEALLAPPVLPQPSAAGDSVSFG